MQTRKLVQQLPGLAVIGNPLSYGGLPVSRNIHLPCLAGFPHDQIQALVEMPLGAATGLLSADPLPRQQGPMHDPVLTEQAIEGRPQLPFRGRHLTPKHNGLASGNTAIIPDPLPVSTQKSLSVEGIDT